MILPLLAALVTSAPADHPRTYLASVVRIPLRRDEALEAFTFETWGVTFKAVCHIPPGWSIKAGGSLTPNGVFEGEGSQGVSWYREASPKDFRALVLVELYSPVQRRDIHQHDGIIPATFKGHATVWGDDADRKAALNADNIRLSPARSCPSH